MKCKPVHKLTALALCVLLCVASCAVAFAQGTVYTIKEIDDMQLTIGSELMAVTRSTDSSDGYFALPNNSYDDVMKKMADSGIYLLATDSQQSITLSVSMFENDDTRRIDNYNRLTESELSNIVVGYQQNSDGTTYSASTVDEGAQDLVWIDFEFRATVGESVNKQYQACTVVNGKNVSITIQRNDGDVIASDYDVLKSVVSSVKFGNAGLPKNFMLYIIIGAAVLIIIILIIVIILAKRASGRRKKAKNDKIIQELAGKYNTGRSSHTEEPARETEEAAPVVTDFYEDEDDMSVPGKRISAKTQSFDIKKARSMQQTRSRESYDDDDFDSSRPVKSYTDEEIARLLGDTEDDENFIETLPMTEADLDDGSKDRASVENSLLISEFFDDEDDTDEIENINDDFSDEPDEQQSADYTDGNEDEAEADEEISLEQDLAEIEAEKPLKSVREVFDFSKFLQNARSKAQAELEQPEETPEETSDEEPEPQQEEAPEPQPEEQPEETAEPEQPSGELPEEEQLQQNEQEELDEFNNDEVLVREEAKHNKFISSSDFFDEAPQKVMGVISREEIEDAEEFDVIDEVEKKATEVEKEPERREPPKPGFFKRVVTGFKSFGKHCGYFITNVRREIKRGSAKKQRRKAEEERRRRAAQRAERQKAQPANGGLVQVKRQGGRRPGNRG